MFAARCWITILITNQKDFDIRQRGDDLRFRRREPPSSNHGQHKRSLQFRLRQSEQNDNASDAERSFNHDGLRRNGKDEIL